MPPPTPTLEVAGADRLVEQPDRAHARGADLVDRLGGDLLRDPALDLSLARGDLPLPGLQHLAYHDLLDLLRLDRRSARAPRRSPCRPGRWRRARRGRRPSSPNGVRAVERITVLALRCLLDWSGVRASGIVKPADAVWPHGYTCAFVRATSDEPPPRRPTPTCCASACSRARSCPADLRRRARRRGRRVARLKSLAVRPAAEAAARVLVGRPRQARGVHAERARVAARPRLAPGARATTRRRSPGRSPTGDEPARRR